MATKKKNPPRWAEPEPQPRVKADFSQPIAADETPRQRLHPKRGEVWTVDLDPVKGHEQGKRRPALVVSVNEFNTGPAGLVTVLPITSNLRPITGRVPIDPPAAGLTRPSMIISEQCRTISQVRLSRRCGAVSPDTMACVDDALRLFLGL